MHTTSNFRSFTDLRSEACDKLERSILYLIRTYGRVEERDARRLLAERMASIIIDDILAEEREASARGTLKSACNYLKAVHGRTATEGPRRILTEASRLVGTDARGVDLTKRNITRRVTA